ncbi:hypothetical protein H6P81_001518 [Aristolochia fimbriata]|uniref:Uncharacterized protein n=1 Tax=Aristolochia fimbriata TaxID=158543 RepID=A0AAV7F745_ARIFI|nr:hypothetical protein H6P81_001518 [Aristolochia fimbriata]
MDLCSLNLNGSRRVLFPAKICPFRHRHASLERTFLGTYLKWGILGKEDGCVFEARMSRSKRFLYRSMVIKAMGKKNHNSSSSSGKNDRQDPEGDEHEGSHGDRNRSEDLGTPKPHNNASDWRTFRANLVAREQEQLLDAGDSAHDSMSSEQSQSLGLKWAHPIPVPETGCVLVATEKLDGVRTFERTVVLLLRSGTKDRRDGPFGIVINRPLHKKIKHMKPSNADLATTFSDCSLHFGGPLDASMFLLQTGDESLQHPAFEQVIPGLSFGARNSLPEAANLVKKGVLKSEDFRFFVGYAGWQFDQLREEIESDYWFVAACSANLITGGSPDSSSGLWEEILQLMGGPYSELSRKPKQDG